MTKKKVLIPIICIAAVIIIGLLFFLFPRERTPEPELDNGCSLFCEGLLCVKKDGKYGYVNENGRVVIPLQYDYAESFRENGTAWVWIDGERKWINTKGEFVEPRKRIKPEETEDVSWYWENGLYGLQDKDGNPLTEAMFKTYGFFAENGLAMVRFTGKTGYINKSGTLVIPNIFNMGDRFSNNGLALVSVNKRYGYIDSTGEFVIEPQIREARSFLSGLAAIKFSKEDQWGFIDETGEFVIAPSLDYVYSGFGSDGLAIVRKDGRICFIDRKGEVVHTLPEETNTVELGYNDGTLGVGHIYSRNTSYIFDRKGNILIQPDQYDYLSYRQDLDALYEPC